MKLNFVQFVSFSIRKTYTVAIFR